MKNLILLITGIAIAILAVSFTGNKLFNLNQEVSIKHECGSKCSHLADDSEDVFKTHCKEASFGKNYLTNIVSWYQAVNAYLIQHFWLNILTSLHASKIRKEIFKTKYTTLTIN